MLPTICMAKRYFAKVLLCKEKLVSLLVYIRNSLHNTFAQWWSKYQYVYACEMDPDFY